MLTKRKIYMTSEDGYVKKLTRFSLATLALCTASIAPAAFAGDSLLVSKTVTVKFKLSELDSNGGTDKVYAKLKKRATSYCRADNAALQHFGQTKRECITDLMDQFIDSANIETLSAFHISRKSRSI